LRFSRDWEKGNIPGSLLNFLVVLLSLAAVGLLIWHYFKGPPGATVPQGSPVPVAASSFQADPAGSTDKLLKALNDKLQSLDLLKLLDKEVETRPATVQGKVITTYREEFRLPESYSAGQLASQLEGAVQSLGAGETPSNSGSYLFAYSPEWVPVEISFTAAVKPRICLIIDDGGYQKGEALEHLYDFKVPVTVSIIPDVEFSKSLAEEFPDHGVEVMCHMPMEGHEKGAVGGNYKALLKRGMDPTIAEKDVEEALEGLPHCRGLNNHMGSVATEDPELILGVCEALKSRGLFIIDSRTTARSVVRKVALQTGVPVASRNIFLDNIETPAAILKQLGQTAAYAKKHGLAVAIGHFKVVTLRTLQDAIPQLRDQGFQFVYASEVVKDF
jgi:polysaccharide deacetylase 2 family uncharacterized protein YibQ